MKLKLSPIRSLTSLVLAVVAFAGATSTSLAAPANDNFTSRTVLTGTNISVSAYNYGASKETGEPYHAGYYGGKSVWWTWTAPASGLVVVTVTPGTLTYPLLGIYTGTAVTNLTTVASGANICVTFTAVAGTAYQIAVDGMNAAEGMFTLALQYPAPPPNDNFANRITLTGTNLSFVGTNIDASKEIGEPNHGGYAGGQSVWWTWTAPVSGRVAIAVTAGSLQSPLLGVYTGTDVANLTPVASEGGYASLYVAFNAVAGTVYQIAVDGNPSSNGSGGAFNATLQFVAGPPNDDFAGRTALTGTNISITTSNVGASKEIGEPNHAGYAGGKSVWWTWTAPVSGRVAVAVTAGTISSPLLGVYTGTEVTNLTTIAAEANYSSLYVAFNAVAGTEYEIAVDGNYASSGTFTLAVQYVVGPPNDDFAYRTVLTGTNISITASNIGACKEVGEPNHGGKVGGTSVWWTWTAPVSGRVVVTVKDDFDTLVGIYTGTDITSLTPVTSAESYTPLGVAINAVAGTTYQIAVDGNYAASDTFTLTLQYAVGPPNDNFADRMSLTNTDVNLWYVTGSNVGATKELGESPTGYESVWWTWTAPTNGEALIDLEPLGYSGQMTYPWLTVYTGTNISNLNQVYPRVDFGRGLAYAIGRFTVTAGTTYQIWVGTGGNVGNYFLRLTFEPPPPNDNFSNRITITNTAALFQYGGTSINGYNVSATKEAGEPSHCGQNCYYGGKSVWWTWTAPASGRVALLVSPIRYTFDSMVGVYTGSVVSSLTPITNAYTTCTDGHSGVNFPVTAGTTYQIAVDGGGSYGDSGEFTLGLEGYFDINAPSVTITNPPSGQATNATITVSGTANDLPGTGAFTLASGVNLVEVRLNGGSWLPATGTNAWSRALTLASGANLIEARSRDSVGNYSTNASVTVTCGISLAPKMDSSGMHVTFASETNKTYQLEWADSLASPVVWQSVTGAVVSGCGSPMSVCDTNAMGQPQRFYRLRIQ
jgi:hypothetical protein